MKRITLLLIFLLGMLYVRQEMSSDKKLSRKLDAFYKQSEDARAIYTGKTREVYNPIDEAYKPTDFLLNYQDEKVDTSYPFIISLWVHPDDLYSEERGIVKNGYKTGRMWERAARMNIYRNGKRIVSYPAGIRLHGGTSRRAEIKDKSFRLYLRKEYGANMLPNNILPTFNDRGVVKRFVIRRDKKHPLANKFALDLINDLGGMAPVATYAAIYLNGEFYGIYNVFEHLSPEQLAYYFGHEEFVFAKLKGDKDLNSKILYDDFRKRMEKLPLSFSDITSEVDIDSALVSLLVIMFTGNTDWAQGVYLKDTKKNGRWKLISWDLDRAFYPVKGETHKKPIANPWEMSSLALGVVMKKGTVRHSLFKRVRKDPEFKAYFENLIDKMYQHFESEKFKTRIIEYRQIAKDYKSDKINKSIDYFLEFIKHRTREQYFDLKDAAYIRH